LEYVWKKEGHDPEDFGSWETEDLDVALQYNEYDCGLFLISYVLHFTKNPNPEACSSYPITQKYITKLRNQLLDTFLEHATFPPTPYIETDLFELEDNTTRIYNFKKTKLKHRKKKK